MPISAPSKLHEILRSTDVHDATKFMHKLLVKKKSKALYNIVLRQFSRQA
jgi:hypothetical protein